MQCTINRKNLDSIPELFQLANDLNFDAEDNILSFPIVNPVGRGSEGIDELSLNSSEYERAFQLIVQGLLLYKASGISVAAC